MEPDTAPEIYVTGESRLPATPVVRTLEHDVAGLTADNPYSGNTERDRSPTTWPTRPKRRSCTWSTPIRPGRRPSPSSPSPTTTFTTAGQAVPALVSSRTTGYAWDHGDYAAEINNNWAGFVGPGVAALGLDGSTPEEGPSSAGLNSGQETSVENNNPGHGSTRPISSRR